MAISALRMAGLGVLAAIALSSAPALAAAHGTLTFDEPTGTVSGADPIPVYLTFTLDQNSDALVYESGQVTSGGYSQAQLAASGFDLSRPYRTYLSVSFTCSGTFTTGGCTTGGTPYTFDFNYSPPSFLSGSIDLAPGASLSHVLYGTFNPIGGAAPAGSYSFYTASILVGAYQDAGDDPDTQPAVDISFDLASTCAYDGSTCSFTRDVTPVPEPGEWAMIAAGLGLVGAVAKRRRRA